MCNNRIENKINVEMTEIINKLACVQTENHKQTCPQPRKATQI